MSSVKPFLKWVGGKTQIITDVLERFPLEMNHYHEPFLGGGSVLLALLASKSIVVSGNIYASDVNVNLIGLYKNIQRYPDRLIVRITELKNAFLKCKGNVVNRKPVTEVEGCTSPESFYYWIRYLYNQQEDRESINVSAMFLFLNKTCFRGMYREGPKGFNVPYGNYKQTQSLFDEEHIHRISILIQRVVFQAQSFEKAFLLVQEGDFVYVDPPYAPENELSFVGYTSNGFDLEQHKLLFRLCRGVSSFLMSNADVEFVKNEFPDGLFQTRIISCRRAIHSKEPNTRTNEVLISKR